MKNSGTEFEKILETQHEAYRVQGLAKLCKVTPPILVFGGHGSSTRMRVVKLDNPYLDFCGAWIERGGRAMHVECKVTAAPRLAFYSESGIKPNQMANLYAWDKAGAVVGVLWFHAGIARLVTLAQIEAADAEGRKSVEWSNAYKLFQTGNLVFWDYLAAFRVLYPCTALENGQSSEVSNPST